jgi:hypothetical protein
MYDWLPADVVALGRVNRTAINGEMLGLPPEALDAVVQRLGDHGVAIDRDDGIVERACGGWRYD